MAHGQHAKSLPSELNAPLLLNRWRRRALVVGAVFAVLSIVLAFLAATIDHDGINHLLRSYLLGFIFCWGFTVGGLAMLMVQYLSGGKWGLLVRRPLEAMSRCLPLVMVMFLPIGFFMKKLYLWAKFSNPAEAYRQHLITHEQAHAIAYKHPMLSIPSVWIQIRGLLRDLVSCIMHLLNRWGLQRDADPHPNVRFWQVRLENISGFGVVVYSITMTRLRNRLGHVARSDLVLVGLWVPVPGRAGLRGLRALHHHRAPAFPGGADQNGAAQNRASTTWANWPLPSSC